MSILLLLDPCLIHRNYELVCLLSTDTGVVQGVSGPAAVAGENFSQLVQIPETQQKTESRYASGKSSSVNPNLYHLLMVSW
jgi:hypothetical protein